MQVNFGFQFDVLGSVDGFIQLICCHTRNAYTSFDIFTTFPFLLMMVPRYLVLPTHFIASSLMSFTSANSIFPHIFLLIACFFVLFKVVFFAL